MGPVATGNMKAQLAAMAAGADIKIGSKFPFVATAAKTGRRAATVAVLDVNSVRKITMVTIANIRKIRS